MNKHFAQLTLIKREIFQLQKRNMKLKRMDPLIVKKIDLPLLLGIRKVNYQLRQEDIEFYGLPICPWAHRQVIVRKLLGLEDVISLGTANPIRTEQGWEFSLDEGGVDPVLGIRYLSEVYVNADPEYNGRATVPAVVDITTKKVVNNDYFKLTNYWETAWAPFHKEGAPDLYPEYLRAEIDALNDVIFHEVNNGVYKCGFARSQEAYEKSYNTLFARLDDLEQASINTALLIW